MKFMAIFLVILMLRTYMYERQPLYAEGDINVGDMYSSQEEPLDNTEEYLRLAKECIEKHESFDRNESELYCNATFDQFLCWGYVKAGSTASQPCPPDLPFIDPTSFDNILNSFMDVNDSLTEQAIRYCSTEGNWLDQNNKSSAVGWTNFIKCFPAYMQDLLENFTKSTDLTAKFEVAVWIRGVEYIGLLVSAVSLTVAIVIFVRNKQLINSRTKIHLHLFCVLLVQCVTTLLIYTDQEAFNFLAEWNVSCKIVYSLLEYLTSNSFTFMLIEGVNLYRTVSADALRPPISHKLLITGGYLGSLLNTVIWVTAAVLRYEPEENNRCWFGYNLDSIYWILQGPRLVIIAMNLFIMLGVVKILLTKLTKNHTTELQRIKTAVRAAMFLMPLLGITNFLSMTSAPLEHTTLTFAMWAFFAYFFRSVQGLLISYIYCFRNKEVSELICPKFDKKLNDRYKFGLRFRAYDTEWEEMSRRANESSRSEPPKLPELHEANCATCRKVRLESARSAQVRIDKPVWDRPHRPSCACYMCQMKLRDAKESAVPDSQGAPENQRPRVRRVTETGTDPARRDDNGVVSRRSRTRDREITTIVESVSLESEEPSTSQQSASLEYTTPKSEPVLPESEITSTGHRSKSRDRDSKPKVEFVLPEPDESPTKQDSPDHDVDMVSTVAVVHQPRRGRSPRGGAVFVVRRTAAYVRRDDDDEITSC